MVYPCPVTIPSAQHTAESFRGLQPQEWHEVLAPPPEIAAQVEALIPSPSAEEHRLVLDELEALARDIVARPDIWEPLVVADPARRRYRLAFEDDRVDVWVLSWMPGQGTGFHDHDLSGVGLAIARGMCVEKQMLIPKGATRLELVPGDTRQGGAGYIHSVAWGDGLPAVSIHCYSPPLIRVGQYKVDEHGILSRNVEHGRQELMDFTIAAIDPSRTDG